MINSERLVQTFLDLVRIDSPSGQEEAVSRELARRCAALGAQVEQDEHWNVIARWSGSNGAADPVLLSAHMDTVGQDTGIKPEIRDGVIYSDGTTILGGDDKSGVATILEVVASPAARTAGRTRRWKPPSPSVKRWLRRARLLDKGKLTAAAATCWTGGPIGGIVTSAPSQDSLEAWVHGKKAHAGAEPEKGINAIRAARGSHPCHALGRIDVETTANIGIIQGGEATNIVPDKVYLKGEARSRDDLKLAAQTAAIGRRVERGRRAQQHPSISRSSARTRPQAGG